MRSPSGLGLLAVVLGRCMPRVGCHGLSALVLLFFLSRSLRLWVSQSALWFSDANDVTRVSRITQKPSAPPRQR